jgi:hypothetical protein
VRSLGLALVVFTAGLPHPHGSAAAPAPEIQKLIERLQGTWSIEERYERSEMMPKGGESHGEEVWRAGPGGLSLIESYHSRSPALEVTGTSVTWWDGTDSRYRTVWCSSDLPDGCMQIQGRWVDEGWVLTDRFEVGGRKLEMTEIFSAFTPASFLQRLYQGAPGGEPRLIMTIRATRKAAPARKR